MLSGLDFMLLVAVQESEVAALRAEDLGERADVELPGVGAGGGAGPEPVAAADGLMVRHPGGDRPGDAQAGAGGRPGAAARETRRGRAGSRRGRPSRAG
jgi:hypothetical protein